MEVSVAFARQENSAGTAVTALLRSRALSSLATVTAVAQGQLQADPRWVKVSTAGLFSPAPGPSGALVFATSRESVPVSALAEKNGVVVQFDLPGDALPSFRGLCQTCTYNLAVTITLPNSEQSQPNPRTLLFPFTVVSRGSSSTPYATRLSAMSVFPASVLPQDNVLVPPPQSRAATGGDGGEERDYSDDDEDNDGAGESKGSEVYNISNKGHICSVAIIRSSLEGRLEGGGVLALRFSFLPPAPVAQKGEEQGQGQEQRRQSCKAVRARLLQCETRLDGSRVQERPLALATLPSTDCVAATLSLPLPSGCGCDFSSPLNCVTHRLEVDFYLDSTGQPFCWTLPIQVWPPREMRGTLAAAADVNAALEASVVTVERVE